MSAVLLNTVLVPAAVLPPPPSFLGNKGKD